MSLLLSYRKRDASPDITSETGSFHTRSAEVIEGRKGKKSKGNSLKGIWTSIFHSSRGSSQGKTRSLHLENDSPMRRSGITSCPNSSTETLNSIQSSDSFSFLRPFASVGRRRKKGKRIPIQLEPEVDFPVKPQHPQMVTQAAGLNGSGRVSAEGKVLLNLKSKYNLQSCESLAIASSTYRKHRHPNPPSSNPVGASSSSFSNTQQSTSTTQISKNPSRDPFQKKRRAPLPPQTHPLSQLSTREAVDEKGREASVVPEDRDGQASGSGRGSGGKNKLHVRGKRPAPNPPPIRTESPAFLGERKSPSLDAIGGQESHSQSNPTEGGVGSVGKEMFQQVSPPQLIPPSEPSNPRASKLHPRPWYKRTSKISAKAEHRRHINLPNLSHLDREAARIIEEKNRRSAESDYNQNAQELITMFNKNFSNGEKRNELLKDGEPLLSGSDKQIESSSIQPNRQQKAPPRPHEEKKKLAIVQPQKPKPRLCEKSAIIGERNGSPNPSGIRSGSSGTDWPCPRCTLLNSSFRQFCDVCFYRKKSSDTGDRIGVVQAVAEVRSHPPIRVPEVQSPSSQNAPIPSQNSNQNQARVECVNFLSGVPPKDNLLKEKFVDLKVVDEKKSILDIKELREARLAFFANKNQNGVSEFKPNNLNPRVVEKEYNVPIVNSPSIPHQDQSEDDLEMVDFLLRMHQGKKSPLPHELGAGSNTWRRRKFRPIEESILENSDSADFDKIYDEYRKWNPNQVKNRTKASESGGRIQSVIRKEIQFYEGIMEAKDMESELAEYRKKGAIPKGLVRDTKDKALGLKLEEKKKAHARVASLLLHRLDSAISQGQYRLAAKLAYELATQNNVPQQAQEEPIRIRVYVEDRMMQQGPFMVQVRNSMSVGDLKRKIEAEWSIPLNFQKWILGKKMAESDDDTLSGFSLQNDSLSFLYLVTPQFKNEEDPSASKEMANETENPMLGENVSSIATEIEHESTESGVHDEKLANNTAHNQSPQVDTQSENLDLILPEEGDNTMLAVLSSASGNEMVISAPSSHVASIENEVEESQLYENPTSATEIENASSILPELPSEFPSETSSSQISSHDSDPSNLNSEATYLNPVTNELSNGSKSDSEGNSTQLINAGAGNSRPQQVEHDPTRKSLEANASFLFGSYKTVHPAGRRLSGTLLKQIERFETLNNPQWKASKAEADPEIEKESLVKETPVELGGDYGRLLELEKSDLIKSEVEVECPICMSLVEKGEGVILRDCLHTFCGDCLVGTIEYSEEVEVQCPFRDKEYACESIIQEREIKALVPIEVYNRRLAKSVKMAQLKISNAFQCLTQDCPGWCVFEDRVTTFHCPVCSKANCLNCRAIHEGMDCDEYERHIGAGAETDENVKSSRLMLETMISRGEALECPACHVVLLKKWGCDWVRCSYCKTEICWVTKSFRWGPNGKGDTSGGCKCGLNGVKCHPKCTYCH